MSLPPVQISSEHYFDLEYNTKERFNTFWHQFHEVVKRNPNSVLEIGTGNGIVKYLLHKRGVNVKVLDIDSSLNPDILGSVTDIPLQDGSFDIVLCCQVLEHIPYDEFRKALTELKRVAAKYVILSLPDLSKRYRVNIKIPFFPEIKFLYKIPRLKPLKWTFNGEHWWNIGCEGFSLNRVIQDIKEAGFVVESNYSVFEMSWHRFFILKNGKE